MRRKTPEKDGKQKKGAIEEEEKRKTRAINGMTTEYKTGLRNRGSIQTGVKE